MKQKPSFVKDNNNKNTANQNTNQQIPPQQPVENINNKSKIGEGFEINYIVLEAPDTIRLSTAINNYINKFPFMVPIGGICFIADDGKNYVCQSMVNKDLKTL